MPAGDRQTAAEALAIFRAAAPRKFFEDLRKASGLRAEGGVYKAELTTWLMIRQHLDGKGSDMSATAAAYGVRALPATAIAVRSSGAYRSSSGRKSLGSPNGGIVRPRPTSRNVPGSISDSG